MKSRTRQAPEQPRWRAASGIGISQTLLIACTPFGPRLPALAVARAIALGMQGSGLHEPDLCPVDAPACEAGDDAKISQRVALMLEELDLDARLRGARAVVVGAQGLNEPALAAGAMREIATRARQGGVPAYAITRESALDAFDARVLDLQMVLRAQTRAQLTAAGRELALLV